VDLNVALNPMITDDDPNLAGATAEITRGALPGDALLAGALAGTGITVSSESTDTRLVLEGRAPIDSYLDALRNIQLSADEQGLRELTFRVEDQRGAVSDPVRVRVDLTTEGADFGDDDDNILTGLSEINDAIAGRGGDDQLFGLSGNDILDGGRGNDILVGGLGDDTLIGGPGADELWGNARFQPDPGGADTFLYFSLADRGDRIMDFGAAEGDVLDFSELLSGATPDTLGDFVSFTPDAGNIEVSVDVDGSGSDFAPIAFLTLVDPTGVTSVETAASNGTVAV
jgi:Ca2+-binding RTX toxin-like protein